MSSAVVSTSAASGRLFVFDDEVTGQEPLAQTDITLQKLQSVHQKLPPLSITSASRLGIRSAPEMAPSGISAVNALTGGLPRGCITEICGPASSGRTTVMLAALAAATSRGEFCAVIDASDALDPHSALAAGIQLDRLLCVRCGEMQEIVPPSRRKNTKNGDKKSNPSEHRLEQVLRATDLLLESGGFGLIVLDLAHLPPQVARRIPLTTWFRFRRAIEHKPTILLAIEQQPIAGSCSSLLLQLAVPSTPMPSSQLSHSHLLTGLEIKMKLASSRLDRKPARSIAFETRTTWAG